MFHSVFSMHNGQKTIHTKLTCFKHFYYKKAAVVSNFCLIGKIHHNFLVPRMIELVPKIFMPIQTLDLHWVEHSLVPKIEICLEYFLDKNYQKQPLWYIKGQTISKKIMVSSTLPKNERWDNFRYIKLSQRSFFGKIEDTINCFRDLLTFSCPVDKRFYGFKIYENVSQCHSKNT